MYRRIASPKFTLKSLLVLFTLIAIGIALVSNNYHRRDLTTQIVDRASWDSATQNEKCLLLIGGDTDLEARNFRETYRKFGIWSEKNGYHPLEIYLESHGGAPNDPWGICLRLCNNGRIPPNTFENCGVGKLIWVENGILVDSMNVSEILALDEHARIDLLRTQTKQLFAPIDSR